MTKENMAIRTISDLLENAEDLTSYELENRLNKLIRSNYKYKNLNHDNRDLVLDIIKKYLHYIRQGKGITTSMRLNEIRKLRRKQTELDLSESDMDDIKDILAEFRK